MGEEFYSLAFLENEGLGTIYEYMAKYEILKRFVNWGSINKILIAGLPERYGYSLDFVYLSFLNNFYCEVVDERSDKLDEFKYRVGNSFLGKKKLITRCLDLKRIEDFYNKNEFDLVLSCEVIQRIQEDQRSEYLKSLKQISKMVVLFMPNGDNSQHTYHSGLKVINKEQIISIMKDAGIASGYYCGYVDMPPWPPGIKNNSRDIMLNTKKWYFVFLVLRLLYHYEFLLPSGFVSRFAHLIYVAT